MPALLFSIVPASEKHAGQQAREGAHQEICIEIFANSVRLKAGHRPSGEQDFIHCLVHLFVALATEKPASRSFGNVPHGSHFGMAHKPSSSVMLKVSEHLSVQASSHLRR